MNKRQRKKWPWIECSHLEYVMPLSGYLYAGCKQTGDECQQELCKKCFVSKFKKQCVYIEKKVAIRYNASLPTPKYLK